MQSHASRKHTELTIALPWRSRRAPRRCAHPVPRTQAAVSRAGNGPIASKRCCMPMRKYPRKRSYQFRISDICQINCGVSLVFLKNITTCNIRKIYGSIMMDASHTANIASSFKTWSAAHPKRSNDNDQPRIGTPIALADPNPQELAEQSAQAEHRRSFS